jgi:pimeloyl-ACP methyl ester carboxylesterase
LAVARVGAEGAQNHLIMLHGIYGRGRNWQSIARAVAATRPEYACWLVDLPHHGDSGPGAHGETVIGLAADVGDWLTAQHLEPSALLGHSYGGKVALALADRARAQPLQVWVIDSTPEAKEPSGSAWGMLQVVRDLPPRFATRDAAVAALVEAGYSVGVAQWMSTNLARGTDGFTWRLDFDAMERLLLDFFTTDLWPVIDNPAPRHELHFLKASRSSAMSDQAARRLEAAGDRVHVHHREGGHWIHAESPDVVVALLVEHLGSGREK